MYDKTKHTAGRMDLVALALVVLTYLCIVSSVSAAPLLTIEVSNKTLGEYESLSVLNPGDGNRIEGVGLHPLRCTIGGIIRMHLNRIGLDLIAYHNNHRAKVVCDNG